MLVTTATFTVPAINLARDHGVELVDRDRLLSWAQPPDQQVTEPEAPPSLPPAGWYADPSGATRWRWWDGVTWTSHIGPGMRGQQ
jgi:hypothetical protein